MFQQNNLEECTEIVRSGYDNKNTETSKENENQKLI